MKLAVALGLAAALSLTAAPAPGQQPPLRVAVQSRTGAPTVIVGPVLADEALLDAVHSGLPLRLRFNIELWRDALFDQLVDQRSWTAVVAFEPLERMYLAGDDDGDVLHRLSSFDEARVVIERDYAPAMRPERRGRYYYLVTLEIETLSLSDLDELERWLRGELEPAVRGRTSVTGAIGGGLKRLLIRVLDLPARRYQARSGGFRIG